MHSSTVNCVVASRAQGIGGIAEMIVHPVGTHSLRHPPAGYCQPAALDSPLRLPTRAARRDLVPRGSLP